MRPHGFRQRGEGHKALMNVCSCVHRHSIVQRTGSYGSRARTVLLVLDCVHVIDDLGTGVQQVTQPVVVQLLWVHKNMNKTCTALKPRCMCIGIRGSWPSSCCDCRSCVAFIQACKAAPGKHMHIPCSSPPVCTPSPVASAAAPLTGSVETRQASMCRLMYDRCRCAPYRHTLAPNDSSDG